MNKSKILATKTNCSEADNNDYNIIIINKGSKRKREATAYNIEQSKLDWGFRQIPTNFGERDLVETNEI